MNSLIEKEKKLNLALTKLKNLNLKNQCNYRYKKGCRKFK